MQTKNVFTTIGVLLTDLRLSTEADFPKGIVDGVQVLSDGEGRCRVLCFVSGSLGENLITSAVLHVVTDEGLDGLIVSASMGRCVPEVALRRFQAHHKGLPIVTGAPERGAEDGGGLVQVLFDDQAGIHRGMSHLSKAHGCRRIALIRGPEGQPEADACYRAYRDAMASFEDTGVQDLFLDGALQNDLVVASDLTRAGGRRAMETLLERAAAHGGEIEAVVVTDPEAAVGAYDCLVAHDIGVPRDMALIGLGDAEPSDHLWPPLTMVQHRFYQMGYEAARCLMGRLGGQEIPERVTLPAELVLRRSCGCMPIAAAPAGADLEASADGSGRPVLTPPIGHGTGPSALLGTGPGEGSAIESLWQALLTDRDAETAGFLGALEHQLCAGQRREEPVRDWQAVLSELRRRLLESGGEGNQTGEPRSVAHAEDLLHQARVLVAQAAERAALATAAEVAERNSLFREFSAAVAGAMRIDDTEEAVRDFFPRLGIEQAFTILFSNGESGPLELVGLYSERHRRLAPFRFPLRRLLDEDFYVWVEAVSTEQPLSLVVLPLTVDDRQFGFVLLRSRLDDGVIYHQIAQELGAVLFRQQRLDAVEEARRRAEVSLAEMTQARGIAERLQQAPDAEAVLRIALEELSEALGATQAVARLGTRDQLLGVEDDETS